jgi:competence protein ComEA
MTADGGEARPVGRASSADPRDDAGLLININTATAAELERLPGIGPSRAASILQHREERGGFRSVEDLLGVHQIGPGILSSLKPQVTVGEAIGSPATAPDRAVGESADAATPLAAPSDPSPPAPVNINAASLEELQRIHGIGPVLAARIIERRSRAPFQSPRELLEIQGIGETTLEKMLPMVVVR